MESEPKDGESVSGVKLLTTEEVLVRLNVSKPTLYKYLAIGKLHALKKRSGSRWVNYYHPDAVDVLASEMFESRMMSASHYMPSQATTDKKFARSVAKEAEPEERPAPSPPKKASARPSLEYHGDVASEISKLFNNGGSVRDAVIEHKVTYEVANHIYEAWKSAGPEIHLSAKQVASLQARFDWYDKPSAEGLVKAMNSYLEREIQRALGEKPAGASSTGELAGEEPDVKVTSSPGPAFEDFSEKERALLREALAEEIEEIDSEIAGSKPPITP